MKVGITGAGGYVGSHFARCLEERGHTVVRVSRSNGFQLGEPVPLESLAGLDALIHVAYDFTARGPAEIERVNVQGSIALFDAAAKARVGRLIFVSSMAAFDGCRSLYGRGKQTVEAHVLRLGGYVVRPGTIYGGEGGGIFRKLSGLARLPMIPLPGTGRQALFLIHIDDLSVLMERLLGTDLPDGDRLFRAASPEVLTLREVLERIANRRKIFLPIPTGFLMMGLRAAETVLGSKCPVRSDSLLSLLNSEPAPDLSLPPPLRGTSFRSF